MQWAVFPLRHTWISQGMNGAVSHRDTLAIDFGTLKDNRDTNLYAPFDGIIVFHDSMSKGGALAFQSKKKVMFADGREDYMTLITAHDNNPPKVGTEFRQGEVYSHMGTAGNVALHCHLEVQVGKFEKWHDYTRQGYYKWPNTIEPYHALFLTDDTYIKEETSVAHYPWIVMPSVTKDVERNELVDQIQILVSGLRVRTEPSVDGQTLGYANEYGFYDVLEKRGDALYTWYRISGIEWVADKKGLWCEFMEKDETVKQLEEEVAQLEKENEKLTAAYNTLLEKYDKMTKSRNANKEKKEEYLKALKKVRAYETKVSDLLTSEGV